jgi:pyruvate dehydrogenase E1 component alpha subunit
MTNRDPIVQFEAALKEFGVIDDAGIEAVREAVAKEIAEGIDFAKESPMPEIADHDRYVYTEVA